MAMMHKTNKPKDTIYGLYIFLSNIPLAAAVMFSMAMLFWPGESFPQSYDLMFSLASKYFYGGIILPIALGGYWAVLDGNRQAWQRINLGLAIMFFSFAILFAIPGSITGTGTYSVIAGNALLQATNKWLPIGFPRRSV